MSREGSDGVGCITGPTCPEQAAVMDYYMLLPWWHDRDGDCWDNDDEDVIGTDDWDDCSDNPSDDAWPPDFNNDTQCNVLDILMFIPQFPTAPDDPRYNPRYDLNADGKINVFDVLIIPTKVRIPGLCTNP